MPQPLKALSLYRHCTHPRPQTEPPSRKEYHNFNSALLGFIQSAVRRADRSPIKSSKKNDLHAYVCRVVFPRRRRTPPRISKVIHPRGCKDCSDHPIHLVQTKTIPRTSPRPSSTVEYVAVEYTYVAKASLISRLRSYFNRCCGLVIR